MRTSILLIRNVILIALMTIMVSSCKKKDDDENKLNLLQWMVVNLNLIA